MRFHNQLAVVTGAAQGIGAAVVQQLLAQGARVALLDRNQAQLEAFYRTLNPDVCSIYVVDIADAQAIEQCIEQVEKTQGAIALLANVAGILHLSSLLEGSVEHWLDTFAVNTHGVFYVSRAVGRRMCARGEGAIVTVASNASNTPRLNMGAYAASKAASTQLTQCLGLELAGFGIRCNVVSPGSTETDMQRQLWHSPQAKDVVLQGSLEQFRLGIPLQRIAQPEDVAQAVCFLLSDEAKHITMHDLRVDGGATI